jgi:hypothetical protein
MAIYPSEESHGPDHDKCGQFTLPTVQGPQGIEDDDSYPAASATGLPSGIGKSAGDAPKPEELAAWDREIDARLADFKKPQEQQFSQERGLGIFKSRNLWLRLALGLFFLGVVSTMVYSIFESWFGSVPAHR